MKQSNIKFAGFSPETFQFFAELEEYNYKPWFDEHKPVYESEVLQPLKALAAALSPFFAAMDAQIDLRPAKMVSRIYRDVRFSKNKAPYKNQMWISFQRPFVKQDQTWLSFPGFYLEIGKNGIGYGMGMYDPQAKIMTRYREMVEYEPTHFKQITQHLVEKYHFQLGGEEYKRPMKNNLDEYFQPWIQRKGIYLYKQVSRNELLLSEKLIPYMEKEFGLLQPLYEFFAEVCD
ncbi:hypothetical protein FACS189413_15190 [Bacteroidia bacterium]|nr:hypothetical protein FACS189413_15190 [Bacteroidia bacterium]